MKKIRLTDEEMKSMGLGRRSKYGFEDFEVGDAAEFETEKESFRARSSADYFAKKLGRKFASKKLSERRYAVIRIT